MANINGLYISDVNKMIDNLNNISGNKNSISNYIDGVNDIIRQIDTHWISEGEDKRTLINNLNLLQEKINNDLLPILDQFVNTMNAYVEDSVNISNNT
ncbi:MAG: hypothetical protein ACLUFU_06325 [Bacilli bacterium]